MITILRSVDSNYTLTMAQFLLLQPMVEDHKVLFLLLLLLTCLLLTFQTHLRTNLVNTHSTCLMVLLGRLLQTIALLQQTVLELLFAMVLFLLDC